MKDRSSDSRAGLRIPRYAAAQTADLLRRTAFQANRVSRLRNQDSVHDLRVSIRRLSQALRAFGGFFPAGRAKKLRRKMTGLMDLASQVRNRDVALDLVRDAGIPAGSPLVRALAEGRQEAEHALLTDLKRWGRLDFEKKWRARLEL